MIEFRNITKSFMTPTGRVVIFRDLSFNVPDDKNIALIGRNGAGKSTLMRMIAGLDMPDKGKIVTRGSISWPMGLSGGFQGSLTARDNVKFVGRVYGADGEKLRQIVQSVERFAEIGDYFDQPVKTFSSGMRSRVAFGLSLAFDFDYYLIDEAMSTGDAHFRNKAQLAFKNRISKSKVILISHSMSQVRAMCDYVLLVHNGAVLQFGDIEEGIEMYETTC